MHMDRDMHYDMMFMENFIQFGALHRAKVSWSLLKRFDQLGDEDGSERASIALEIVQTYLNAHEDLALWLQALDEWARDPTVRVQEALHKAKFWAGKQGFDEQHGVLVAKLRVGSGRGLAKRFGLPYDDDDDWSWTLPEAREWIREETDELAGLLYRFFGNALDLRNGAQLTFWKAWNKAKHGLQVVHAYDHNGSGSVTIRLDPVDSSRDIGVSVQPGSLRRFVVASFLGNMFLGRLLNLLYQKRFEDLPDVKWLGTAVNMDSRKVSKKDLSDILESSVAARQDLVLDPRQPPALARFFPTGFELEDDW